MYNIKASNYYKVVSFLRANKIGSVTLVPTMFLVTSSRHLYSCYFCSQKRYSETRTEAKRNQFSGTGLDASVVDTVIDVGVTVVVVAVVNVVVVTVVAVVVMTILSIFRGCGDNIFPLLFSLFCGEEIGKERALAANSKSSL